MKLYDVEDSAQKGLSQANFNVDDNDRGVGTSKIIRKFDAFKM